MSKIFIFSLKTFVDICQRSCSVLMRKLDVGQFDKKLREVKVHFRIKEEQCHFSKL